MLTDPSESELTRSISTGDDAPRLMDFAGDDLSRRGAGEATSGLGSAFGFVSFSSSSERRCIDSCFTGFEGKDSGFGFLSVSLAVFLVVNQHDTTG